MPRPLLARAAGAYLVAQGLGVLAWWGVMLLVPVARAPFRAAGAPDASLLAFAVADVLLVGVASILAGIGVWAGHPRTGPVLLVHASAAVYAGLYCVSLPLVGDGSGWVAALGMIPVLVVPPLIALGWCTGRLGATGRRAGAQEQSR